MEGMCDNSAIIDKRSANGPNIYRIDDKKSLYKCDDRSIAASGR